MTASVRGLAILLILLLSSCHPSPESTSADSVSRQTLPATAKLSWSEPIAHEWVTVDMNSIEPPRDTTIDMTRLETRKLTGSGFVDLAKPVRSTHHDFASLPDTVIDMKSLVTVPLKFRTSILGKPKKLKTGIPRLRDGATTSVLVYGQETDLSPSANVHQAMQDADGRMWFAAVGGLTMYDGEYSYFYGLEQGLNSLQPWSLFFDSLGRLWCGGYSGIDILDFERGIVQHVVGPEWFDKAYVFNLTSTRGGKIIVASGHEFSILDPIKGTLQRFGSGQGLRGSACCSVIEDSKGRLWFGTTEGVAVFEPAVGIFRYLTEPPAIMGQRIADVHEDARGSIWFTTQTRGVFIYDPLSGELRNIRKEHGIASDEPRALAEDAFGNIYIGCTTTEGGLSVIDPTRTKVRTIRPEGGLPSSIITNLYFDREHQLWLSSPGGGISQLRTQLGDLEHYYRSNGIGGNIPAAIMEDSRGSMWVGTENGIDIIDPATRVIRHITLRQLQSSHRIISLMEDSRGMIWIGIQVGGVTVLDPRTGYLVNYGQEQGICNYDVRKVLEDSKGNMWVSTIAGVNQFNAARTTNRYIDDEHGLSHYSVIDLIEDRDGRIWFASGGGVDVYDPKREELRHLNNTDQNYAGFSNCFMEDDQGRMWVGTDQDGLHIIDMKAGTDRALATSEGMINNNIRSLVDVNGVVYAGTRKGLTTIVEQDSGAFMMTGYSVTEGLPFLDFLHRSVTLTSNGEVWWGLGSAITTLKPIQRSVPTPRTFISGIDLNEQPLDFVTQEWRNARLNGFDTVWSVTGHKLYARKDDSVTKKSSISWDSIRTPYYLPDTMQIPEASNHVTFHFTATRVNDPAQTRYTYILEGLDKSWSAVSDRPYADYRNIPTGQYEFKVRSAGADGPWSKPAVMHFSITPPWWASVWAYGVYFLTLVLGGAAYLRYRHDKLIARQRELEFAVQARTQDYVAQRVRAEHSERIKEQFLANMSHEIRTPMNAVIGITNILLKKDHPPEQTQYLESMRKSSEGLLVILNDILDLSKIEAGMITIEKIPFDIRESISFVVGTLQFKAEEKGLALEHQCDSTIPQLVIGDPTRLQQILINFVSNAIKFTERGYVKIHCSMMTSANEHVTLRFEVIDTGIGMTEDQISRIFEGFTQASSETTRKYGGTGLGLNISRHLVELLGGEISVTSRPKRGSTFAFSLQYPIAYGTRSHAGASAVTPQMIARLTGIRILLAEDNELNRVVTRDTLSLELSHLTLDEAMNGEVAVAMVAAQDYDVILMDVNMPVLDGYEATKRIRTRLQGRKSQTPILALTAGVVRTDLERAIAAGMNGYVTKPFKTGDLLISIYNALEGVTQSHLKHDEIDRTTTVDAARITDLAFLRELTQGDDSLMQKYVSMYFTSTPENLRRIHADMDRSDIPAIARTTHQLKTHLRFMGMQSTAELAEQIEQLAATGTDTKEIATLIARLSEDCERSYAELRSEA